MDSTAWDERYRSGGLVWGPGPNRFLVDEAASLAPGRALDVACGEGRNAIWLAERGWSVVGMDFSAVAVDKAKALAAERVVAVESVCADIPWEPPSSYAEVAADIGDALRIERAERVRRPVETDTGPVTAIDVLVRARRV